MNGFLKRGRLWKTTTKQFEKLESYREPRIPFSVLALSTQNNYKISSENGAQPKLRSGFESPDSNYWRCKGVLRTIKMAFGFIGLAWGYKTIRDNEWCQLYKIPTLQAAKPLGPMNPPSTLHPDNDATLTKNKQSNRLRYNFLADVVDKASHSVVSIEVKDHAMIDWFTGSPHASNSGSGFIVREDGLILTNAHVVANKRRATITVRLPNGSRYSGQVEDVDYASDLATVRINAKGLPILPMGVSANTRLGEWVVALGSPLSLNNSVMAGVVSNVSRDAEHLGMGNDIAYIQTDVAITFGNSGGPLVNLDGEVIGINAMKVTSGISFAIPIDHAKIFLQKAEQRRKAGSSNNQRYMGITMLTLNKTLLNDMESVGKKLPDSLTQGVLVYQVVVGSPAYVAAIEPGDIILKINGVDVKTTQQVYDMVAKHEKLVLTIWRDWKKYSATVIPESVMK